MSDTPLLRVIAELSTLVPNELRFVNLTESQMDGLLKELEVAHDAILNGELFGVQIIEDIYKEQS